MNKHKDCFSRSYCWSMSFLKSKMMQQKSTGLERLTKIFSFLALIYSSNSNLSKPLLFFRLRTILTHSRPNRDIHCQSSTGSIVLLNDRQNNQKRHSFVPLTFGPKKLVKTSSRQFSSLLQQRRRPIHFIPPHIPTGSRGLGWVRNNYQISFFCFTYFWETKKVRIMDLFGKFIRVLEMQYLAWGPFKKRFFPRENLPLLN